MCFSPAPWIFTPGLPRGIDSFVYFRQSMFTFLKLVFWSWKYSLLIRMIPCEDGKFFSDSSQSSLQRKGYEYGNFATDTETRLLCYWRVGLFQRCPGALSGLRKVNNTIIDKCADKLWTDFQGIIIAKVVCLIFLVCFHACLFVYLHPFNNFFISLLHCSALSTFAPFCSSGLCPALFGRQSPI